MGARGDQNLIKGCRFGLNHTLGFFGMIVNVRGGAGHGTDLALAEHSEYSLTQRQRVESGPTHLRGSASFSDCKLSSHFACLTSSVPMGQEE